MYDALLGGSHNFEVDRLAAEAGKRLVPDLPRLALSNRAFLRRGAFSSVPGGRAAPDLRRPPRRHRAGRSGHRRAHRHRPRGRGTHRVHR
ncbi:SAM-dependent methyltransferase [Nocardia wallacei]|uniref:SAM-dependent methyltransferase n=1 Tax=Nocardia wallacei TaxID=480035 RepID=UPI002457EA74|nr:SAM-dependent methyltransferase [Nocardia wallacei]